MLKRPLMRCKTKKFEIPINWFSGPFWTLKDPFDFQENIVFLMLKRPLMRCETKKFEIPINWSSGPFWTLKGPFDFHENIVFLILKRPLMRCKTKKFEIPINWSSRPFWAGQWEYFNNSQNGDTMHVFIEVVEDGRTDGGGRKHSHKEPCYRPPLNKRQKPQRDMTETITLIES